MKLDSLFVGKIRALPPEGQRSGIYKHPVDSSLAQIEGLLGDQQADLRFHGGAEKAVHQIGGKCYVLIGQHYPHLIDQLIPGALGENLFCQAMHDDTVCIGDVYQVGQATLQVSQPRSPCWKINHKFAEPGLSRMIEKHQISGWYYRVLEPGLIQPGDQIDKIDSTDSGVSVSEFQHLTHKHRPSELEFDQLLASPALATDWQSRIMRRRDYLKSKHS